MAMTCGDMLGQMERTEHARTHAALMSERERVQCCEAEVEVMRKQLEREKSTFEKAYEFMFLY